MTDLLALPGWFMWRREDATHRGCSVRKEGSNE
jgi:hypothetical protein